VSLRGTVVACLAAAVLAWAARSPGQNAVEGDAAPADESGVFLPGDRIRERQFERAGELLANGRWSDAAALFDEILEAERDAFLQGSAEDVARDAVAAAAGTRSLRALVRRSSGARSRAGARLR
jgi:hypothetical protein